VFVNTVDNFIKPWLIGVGIEMPMSLTILGVFGGFLAFGFLGLFIGPTLIAIMFTVLLAWRTAFPYEEPPRSKVKLPKRQERGDYKEADYPFRVIAEVF
jgi:predicted PurR-regulated permease PerM